MLSIAAVLLQLNLYLNRKKLYHSPLGLIRLNSRIQFYQCATITEVLDFIRRSSKVTASPQISDSLAHRSTLTSTVLPANIY